MLYHLQPQEPETHRDTPQDLELADAWGYDFVGNFEESFVDAFDAVDMNHGVCYCPYASIMIQTVVADTTGQCPSPAWSLSLYAFGEVKIGLYLRA